VSFFTVIGLSHAEDMTHSATRCVTDDDQATAQKSEADDPQLAVVDSFVLDLSRQAIEDQSSILEVKTAMDQRPVPLGTIVRDTHWIIVYTKKGA
jgi:hypothetical protein